MADTDRMLALNARQEQLRRLAVKEGWDAAEADRFAVEAYHALKRSDWWISSSARPTAIDVELTARCHNLQKHARAARRSLRAKRPNKTTIAERLDQISRELKKLDALSLQDESDIFGVGHGLVYVGFDVETVRRARAGEAWRKDDREVAKWIEHIAITLEEHGCAPETVAQARAGTLWHEDELRDLGFMIDIASKPELADLDPARQMDGDVRDRLLELIEIKARASLMPQCVGRPRNEAHQGLVNAVCHAYERTTGRKAYVKSTKLMGIVSMVLGEDVSPWASIRNWDEGRGSDVNTKGGEHRNERTSYNETLAAFADK